MRCQKARDFVSRELDGMLPPAETGRLRDHLDSCPDCRQYRQEVVVGQRLLAATEPSLPDNFEWKLQLKLNQTLQQAAGENLYPWHEERTERWTWLRNFGAATAVGLAAVLALAMFFGPADPGAGNAPGARSAVATSDRLPLFQPGAAGLYRQTSQRLVSAGGAAARGRASGLLDRGWSGVSTEDLLTIRRLRDENRRLKSVLLQYQQASELMRTQLDTSGAGALDLQQDR